MRLHGMGDDYSASDMTQYSEATTTNTVSAPDNSGGTDWGSILKLGISTYGQIAQADTQEKIAVINAQAAAAKANNPYLYPTYGRTTSYPGLTLPNLNTGIQPQSNTVFYALLAALGLGAAYVLTR